MTYHQDRQTADILAFIISAISIDLSSRKTAKNNYWQKVQTTSSNSLFTLNNCPQSSTQILLIMQVISTTGRLLNVANSIKASLQQSTRIVELSLDANSFNNLFILFREILRTYCLPLYLIRCLYYIYQSGTQTHVHYKGGSI